MTLKQKRSLKGLKLHSMLERIDTFGEPLPGFNLKGKTTVHTRTGGLLTFFVTVVLLIYSTLKLI